MKPAATGCLASTLQDITHSRAQPTDRREARREFGFVISRSNSVMVGMRTMRKAGSQERGESCFDYSCIPAFLISSQLVLIAFRPDRIRLNGRSGSYAAQRRSRI